jgi:hypothetical protein
MVATDPTLFPLTTPSTRVKTIPNGTRFGRLVVESIFKLDGIWCAKALCDCGQIWIGNKRSLIKGNTTSCGCKISEASPHRIDHAGQRFGTLRVLETYWDLSAPKHSQKRVKAQCDCGNLWNGLAKSLLSGNTRSCGCQLGAHIRDTCKENREERARREAVEGRRCSACHHHYPLSEFYTRSNICKPCRAGQFEVWRRKNPERDRRARKLVQSRRRAKKRGLLNTFHEENYRFMCEYWSDACAICGNTEGLLWTLVPDHWIPFASKDCPGDCPENVLLLCHSKKGSKALARGCNHWKAAKDPILWLHEYMMTRFGPKRGPRKAKAKLRAIEAYFAAARAFAECQPPLLLKENIV